MYAIRHLTEEQESFLSELATTALPNILLNIHGVHIHIHSNVQETIDLIREGYSFFEPDSGETDGDSHRYYIFSLSSDGPGYAEIVEKLFTSGPYPPHCLIPLDYKRIYCLSSAFVLNYFTGGFFTALMEAMLYDDYLIIHGAGLVKNEDEGVIFPGALRCGKSTLTLYLLSQGFRFASDDILLIHRETLKIHPYPRLINIRKDSLTIVPGIHNDYHKMKFSQSFEEPRWFLDKSEHAAEPFKCRYVIFPQIDSGAAKMLPIPKTEAAIELIKNAFYPITPIKRFGSTGENLPTISRILENAVCYRFIQGAPESNFKLIKKTLGV